MKRYLKYICVCVWTCLVVSCQQDAPLGTDADEMVMTYSVKMPTRDASRVAVDGTKVNTLIVEAFEQDGEIWRSAYRRANITKNADGKFSIDVPMMKGRSYKVVFWAQNDEVTAYNTEDLSHIQVNYENYSSGFEAVENLDAFYFVDTVLDLKSSSQGEVELKRPFVYLDFDNKTQNTPKQTILTIQNVCTSFYPLTGEARHNGNSQAFSFTGTEADGTIAACLLFTSEDTEVTINGELKINNGFSTVTKPISISVIDANHRYNAEGEFVNAIHWKNKTELPSYDETNNRYVIQNEAQLAWWMDPVVEGLKEGATEIFIEKDLDMENVPMNPLKLPASFTINGNSKIIQNLKLSGGLLGNATNLVVQNLTISQAEVMATSGHVGILVNTLAGSSTFTGVNITNSSATTTNGAAGGMVGYIVRQSETKRSETLSVTFTNCDLVGVTATGTESEGKFVGLFSGYDNGEQLSFDADCSVDVTTSVADYSSSYIGTNQSCWAGEITNTYDGWLGTETYRRGIVKFGDVRLVPKWDGTTTVAPLTANEDYDGVESGMVIYSPTDIVYLSGKNVNTENVYMREDVDLGSMNFTPIMTCHYFDGLKKASLDYESLTTDDCHTIYNMTITRQVDGNGAAFIKTLYDDDIHRNINFVDAHIELDYDESSGNAYGATLCSHPQYAGTYTVSNVHCYDGYIKAVCKTGGLLGRVAYNTLNCTNCSVSNYRIENYEVNVPENFAKILTDKGLYCSDCIFYPQGEIGGFIGFLQSSATISNCSVTQTVLNCYGQNAKTAKIGFSKFLAISYDVPGRYVNQFIGNVRTSSGETIDISSIKVEGNSYERDSWNHSYLGSTTTYIGGAYAIPVMDNKGSIKIDGKSLNFPL